MQSHIRWSCIQERKVAGWNFIHVKTETVQEEIVDSGLAIDLFPLKKENHAKAKNRYGLVYLQNILQLSFSLTHLYLFTLSKE